jgi:hypothetical protein
MSPERPATYVSEQTIVNHSRSITSTDIKKSRRRTKSKPFATTHSQSSRFHFRFCDGRPIGGLLQDQYSGGPRDVAFHE